MAAQYVCPHCGSKKIAKEQGEDEYFCADCFEFFPEPKTITDEKPREKGGNKKMPIDKTKLMHLHAEGKSDKEIAEVLNVKTGTLWAARNTLGLKPNQSLKRTPKRSIDQQIKEKIPSSNVEKPEIKKQKMGSPKTLSDITAVDMLLAERNNLQARVFKINQAIELLS